MSVERNVQVVKDFFAAMSRGDMASLIRLTAEDLEWVIPGRDWPLAGVYRGRAELQNLLQKAPVAMPFTYPKPPEYVAQGDRVLVIGFARGTVTATKKTFEDHFVFAITVRNGQLTHIREYVDTQALAQASQADVPGQT